MARLASHQKTEEMDMSECDRSFKELTGEKGADFLDMAGKEVSQRNMQVLLHLAIIYANQHGQPGQTLHAPETAVSIIQINRKNVL